MEYDHEQRCFILKDLNSSTGTYLHDSRLQQTAVRVIDGDRVRFGSHGLPLELRLEQGQDVFDTSHSLDRANKVSLYCRRQQYHRFIRNHPSRTLSSGST